MSPGLSVSMEEMAAMSDSVFLEDDEDEEEGDDEEEDEEIEESLDSDSVSKGVKDEGPTAEYEDPAGRGALRRREIALGEGRMPSVFEVVQSSGSVPESERPGIVSALRQPTLTTWMDPEDGIVYIDVPTYPPPVPPAQTPPSLEWSSGLLLVSLAPFIIPSPISLPMISLTVPSLVASPATAETKGFFTELGARVEMQEGLIHDHTVRLKELSPALFERYDKDIGELFTRSGVVRDEIFSQRAALWHAISDTQGENRELRLQLAEESPAGLELAEVVDNMRRGQEPKGNV
ncbi:hypothetical protein Tco_1434403 [Tanacetum coccineum]